MAFNAKTICVNATDFRDAFDFISMGSGGDSNVYICIDTGQIYYKSDAADDMNQDFAEPPPDDIETSDRYLVMPHKNELNLGRRIALTFVAEQLPDDYSDVESFFRRRGAYRRFKDLLDLRGKTQQWYDYEERATDQALRLWCEDNAIQLMD